MRDLEPTEKTRGEVDLTPVGDPPSQRALGGLNRLGMVVQKWS
jgi:hypothetical protein